MKKVVAMVTSLMLLLTPVSASASTSTAVTHRAPVPTASHSVATTGTSQGLATNDVYARSYRSGSRAPSSRVGGSYSRYSGTYGTPYGGATTRTGLGGFGSHLFSFGSGMLLGGLMGHLFHPFGGYYGWGGGYGYHGFSIFGLLIDLLLLYVVYRIVRRLFFRR
ncbi:hypothetical protein [Alicyclobacillus pomorum]|uniref:hypothetical protein n=1 Tax=Alicyclobacillus pomorum TaxID=204470 RepID=UPI000556FAEB|nr:hypothetical protein [Alicyclobacillus pomorum]